ADLNIYDTVGIDLVAMNVNDLVVQGAEPLFFLDYIATPVVDTRFLNDLVTGIADACTRSGCALLGGEPAKMPDLHNKDGFHLPAPRVYARPLGRAPRGHKDNNSRSGMAHITDSGIPGNLCRALPQNLDALVERNAWPRPAVFKFLQDKGNIPEEEMWRVFNM